MVVRMFRGIFKRIPFVESLRAFLEQWGMWNAIAGAVGVAGAGIMTAWAWLESNLPYWGIASVFAMTLVVILAGMNFAYGLFLKRKQSAFLDRVVTIDRDALADELEDMSRKVAGLVGEFRGPMQEAWWKDSANRDPSTLRESHTRIEGQLIEKYSYRHGADVWRLIRRASKVVPVDRGDIWQIQHGVRGEHDLINVYMFLASLADDVRSPKAPIPMTDRRTVEKVTG
ncbi:hypothetical protein [Chelativorans sp. M5D2P16]|uniref:hypothetical protein n=1 Tax=Chelativorans sp. M5D2P16 TaxID=3095678 RepID=UPI002ACAFC87|nr:hypothetical protein [Chelativorans sp. M5D2P16]MDZ5699190.1 hypothetical protein [Chelativorans sp. M5D2P16]